MRKLIRRFKWSFALYNFFHRRELIHNVVLYRRYGVNKKYFSPVSSKDFRQLPTPESFDATVNLHQCKTFRKFSEADRQSLLDFSKNGYAILTNFLRTDEADAIISEVANLVAKRKVKKQQQNKIMFAIHHSHMLRAAGENHDLVEILQALLNEKPVLFQSINFTHGSEQSSHSDSIHMTTYPLGGLIAVWIALEDITLENGPLHYFPRSHRLPYYLNSDYDNEGSFFFTGSKSYEEYEEMIRRKLNENSMEKKIFLAKKGDALIWHANLVHGGEPHLDKSKTRKSMVFHYFSENAICYHEISQRPALIKVP